MKWTQEELADIDLGWEKFSEVHDRTFEAFSKKRRLMGREGRPTPEVEFQDKHEPMTQDELDEYFNKLIELGEQRLNNSFEQTEVTIKLDTDLPIGIAFTGDWHAGQVGTDHRTLIQDNKIIAGTPGLYVVGMGDYIHNAKPGMKPGNALFDSIFPDPMEQYAFAERELLRFKDKILALTIGCHLDWDRQIAGVDTLDDICKKLNTVNLWHGGTIHLEVGHQRYNLGIRHKYKGESGSSTTAAHRTMMDQYPEIEEYDLIALGHLHYCDLQKVTKRGRKRVFIRSGSYYGRDEFAQKIGGFQGERGVPIAIFFPDENRILPFDGSDFNEAVKILSYYRSKQEE